VWSSRLSVPLRPAPAGPVRYWQDQVRLAVKAAIAAVGAWALARYAVGQPDPYFAPLAAFLGVYPTVARSLRKVSSTWPGSCWARAAVGLVADLLAEPDPELLSLRDLDEGGLVRVPEGEPAECAGPLDRVPGRHHPELEAAVIRLRPGERLDSAEYLADVRGQ